MAEWRWLKGLALTPMATVPSMIKRHSPVVLSFISSSTFAENMEIVRFSDVLICTVSLYFSYVVFRLYQNYTEAQSTGFKTRIFPIEIGDPLFTIFGGPFLPLVKRFLPPSFAHTYDLGIYGVEWRDRLAERQRETPGYLVVSLFKPPELFVEDGELANAILSRRREFEQDKVSRRIMNQFGPSLTGSVGEAWSRQRRLIAPMLNERIMETVWDESLQQTNQMMSHFSEIEGGATRSTVFGLRKIAFNILSTIGYGMQTRWSAETPKAQRHQKMDFMEALLHLVDGLLLLLVIPPWLLKQPWMPTPMRQIGEAYYQFYENSSEMLQKEREALMLSNGPRNSFLSSLASAHDAQVGSNGKDARLYKPAFTEDQINGNLYTFTLAGYDTTANTMAYAVAMLVVYPEWQDWVIEETDRIKDTVLNVKSYQEVLPMLERCFAVMVSS